MLTGRILLESGDAHCSKGPEASGITLQAIVTARQVIAELAQINARCGAIIGVLRPIWTGEIFFPSFILGINRSMSLSSVTENT